MNTPTVHEITEADVAAFLKAKCFELLKKYPQTQDVAIQTMYHTSAAGGFTCHYVHLIGSGWTRCGSAMNKPLDTAEADAAKDIDTPERLLASAKAKAEEAAREVATLEAQLATPVLVIPGPLPQLRQLKKVLGMGEEELIAVMKTWISSGCEGDAEWPKAVLADFGLLPTTKGGKRK